MKLFICVIFVLVSCNQKSLVKEGHCKSNLKQIKEFYIKNNFDKSSLKMFLKNNNHLCRCPVTSKSYIFDFHNNIVVDSIKHPETKSIFLLYLDDKSSNVPISVEPRD